MQPSGLKLAAAGQSLNFKRLKLPVGSLYYWPGISRLLHGARPGGESPWTRGGLEAPGAFERSVLTEWAAGRTRVMNFALSISVACENRRKYR
jgi:hypothetical protein